MKKFFSILCILLSWATISYAQLPSIDVKLSEGKTVLFWVSQYNGIESITIQRSTDPKRNFMSIGSLVKQNRGPQKFIDDAPVAGISYYRLLIVFESEIEWYSDVKQLFVDSALIVSSQNVKINQVVEDPSQRITTPIEKPVFSFTVSSKVFTDPQSGNINIVLTDALNKRYSLAFFDAQKKEVLKIDKISKNNLVLDKRNLNRKGILSFKLLDAGKEVEKGFVTVL